MRNPITSTILTLCLISFLPSFTQGSSLEIHVAKEKQVTIAMAQILCMDGDLSGNLVRIEKAIIEAKAKHAEIIVFPESCLLGWINPDAFQRACPIPGKDSEHLCKLAKKYKVFICIGLDEKEGDKLYDSAILIDDTGTILLKHRKINVLPELMTPPYSVGAGIQTVRTKFGTIGVMICADSFLDNVLESMKEKKPDLLLIPYGWAAGENEWPVHGQELIKVVKKAAIQVGCPVIGTDLIGQVTHGPWTGMIYGGQSVAFDPKSAAIVNGKDRERDIAVITLPALSGGFSDSKDQKHKTWVAMHFLDYNTDQDLAKLGSQLAGLSEMGVNTAILEVDYGFRYESHPELRQGDNPITKAGAAEFARLCRKAGMRLFIQFQCLGHQSWAKHTFPLLTVYPELDLTPGAFPGNEGLYCREWDPTNPKVNEIVFALMDELIKAFKPNGMHVGMDEIFLLGSEKSPSTKGMNPASLFARAVNEYHDFIVKKHGLEMMMWGDRLIDAKVYNYGDWEASSYGTAPAADSIPKDIIIADWHYELRETYPSIQMFVAKGFRVLPASWKDVKASNALINNAINQNNSKMLGILFTAWGQYEDPKAWPPLVEGVKLLK